MTKCEHCGKEAELPFRCKFCGHYFCLEHRLPEKS
ncbi:MAG: AN1-type zinc finger domain-containing protein [Candidatus Bathyarchaeia archaeon]